MSSSMGWLKSAGLTRQQIVTFALLSTILNGIVTAAVGTWLAQTYATQQSQRKSVESLTHMIYDRRTRAGMVVSSLRRNAPLDEIQFRKRAYDEAYVDWNKNVMLSLFVIREVGGELKFAALERMFEDDLVGAMVEVDRCLTKAYDRKLAGEDPISLLDGCRMSELHQFVLECGSTFTDELYNLTRLSFSPFRGKWEKQKKIAVTNIRKDCARPAAAEPWAPAPQATAPATGATVPAVPSTAK